MLFLGILVFTLVIALILLFYNYENNRNSLLLTLFLSIYSLYGITHFVVTEIQHLTLSALLFVHFTPLYLAMGPLLYLYVRNTLNDRYLLTWKDALHFIPAGIQALAITPYTLQDFEVKKNVLAQLIADPNVITQLDFNAFFSPKFNFYLRIGLLLIYTLTTLGLIIHYRAKRFYQIKLPYELKNTTFRWLTSLQLFVLLSLTPYLFFIIDYLDFGGSLYSSYNKILLSVSASGLALISLGLLVFPHILYGMPQQQGPLPTLMRKKKKKAKKNIETAQTVVPAKDPEYFNEVAEAIEQYFVEQKPFLRSDFTMAEMVVSLGIPKHHIMYCFRYIFNTGFNDYKLNHKIDWVCIALVESDLTSETIDAIGEKAGFKSKSNFYATFKKYTGMTPLAYRAKYHA
ncbi:MAG: AraC family transcriptional regulator [Flavobacteriaceae bacterium]|nr:AraC family transcriptional regulator [Flavobacteriaceae bacterium]